MIEYHESIRDNLEITSMKDKTRITRLTWFGYLQGRSEIQQ